MSFYPTHIPIFSHVEHVELVVFCFYYLTINRSEESTEGYTVNIERPLDK
jgi:hypothetical protein